MFGMMSVFTIKWHLIFRSLVKESAQFQNTEYLCKIIAQGETWSDDLLPQRCVNFLLTCTHLTKT